MASGKKKKSETSKKSSSGSSKSTSSSLNKYRCVRDPNGKYKTESGIAVSVEKAPSGATVHSRLPHGNAKNKSNFVDNKNLKDVKSKNS